MPAVGHVSALACGWVVAGSWVWELPALTSDLVVGLDWMQMAPQSVCLGSNDISGAIPAPACLPARRDLPPCGVNQALPQSLLLLGLLSRGEFK